MSSAKLKAVFNIISLVQLCAGNQITNVGQNIFHLFFHMVYFFRQKDASRIFLIDPDLQVYSKVFQDLDSENVQKMKIDSFLV